MGKIWTSYQKVFVFRDCFNEEKMEGDVIAINKLLGATQIDGNVGALITCEILSSNIATKLEVVIDEEDGSIRLEFENNNGPVATISLWNNKEVWLMFEIEEELTTGSIQIHYCTIKTFKEYQIL